MKTQAYKIIISLVLTTLLSFSAQAGNKDTNNATSYHTTKINGVEIFYREAESKNKPTILLLHGYPTSSHMFRNLIPELSKKYHVIAPDYPGFGRSEQP